MWIFVIVIVVFVGLYVFIIVVLGKCLINFLVILFGNILL